MCACVWREAVDARLTSNAHTHCQAINLLLETVVPYLLIKSTKNLSRGARAAKDNAAEWGKKSLQWSLAQSKLGASSIVGGGAQGNSQRSDNVVPLGELAEGREASSKQLGDLPSTLSRRRIQRQRSTQTVGDQVKRGCEGVVAVPQPLSSFSHRELVTPSLSPHQTAANFNPDKVPAPGDVKAFQRLLAKAIKQHPVAVTTSGDGNAYNYEDVLRQSQRSEFHPRGDYLDMLMQFGCVLTAAATPVFTTCLAMAHTYTHTLLHRASQLRAHVYCGVGAGATDGACEQRAGDPV